MFPVREIALDDLNSRVCSGVRLRSIANKARAGVPRSESLLTNSAPTVPVAPVTKIIAPLLEGSTRRAIFGCTVNADCFVLQERALPGAGLFDMRIANRPARQAALQADALERIE
jgi:hypothetical protein